MLTNTQLLFLTIMATLGGSFAALLVVGIFAGDFTLAAVNLVLIVALFSSVFVFERQKPSRRLDDLHIVGDIHEEFKI